MKFTWATALVALAGVAAAADSLPDKLQVGVKFRPEVCDDKSQAGDLLAMHYTGTLVSKITHSPFARGMHTDAARDNRRMAPSSTRRSTAVSRSSSHVSHRASMDEEKRY
jgi:hypothetical protein